MLGWAIKCAKVAHCCADVRVVHIPINVVGAIRLGMEPTGYEVSRAANCGQTIRFQEPQGIGGIEPHTRSCGIQNVVE